jgi:omega-6 fatty acid desaturase (delta-12 desaturase)
MLIPEAAWNNHHNHNHHAYTNLVSPDSAVRWDSSWVPYSPQQFRRLPWWHRLLYRLYRSPLGTLPYTLIEVTLRDGLLKNWSREKRPPWRRIVVDYVVLATFTTVYVSAIVLVGEWLAPQRPAWIQLVIGWAMPFLASQFALGIATYFHHTNPEIPWFDDQERWSYFEGNVAGTTHTHFIHPIMDSGVHHIQTHTAHHAWQAIPFYRLEDAQARLEARYGGTVRDYIMSPRKFHDIAHRCKLFDFERGRWVDFDGKPTGPVLYPDKRADPLTA